MGFHTCPYCNNATSSGDVTLTFDSNRTWVMPDMIVHYVQVHNYLPLQHFITDVMHYSLIKTNYRVTRSNQSLQVGYLQGEFQLGNVPQGFVEKLQILMEQAGSSGDRQQSKGVNLNNLRG